MDDVARMYELQQVDLLWTKVKRRLLQIQKLLGESTELQEARQQLAGVEESLGAWTKRQVAGELETRTLASKIDETETMLMSGQVRNPKELEALQANLESLRRHRSQVEDQVLEAINQLETLAPQVAQSQAVVDKLEAAWSSGQADLRQEETKLKQNYLLIRRKREAVCAAMQPEMLERYEHMRQRKGGVAITTLDQNTCNACHVSVPTGVISNVRNGSATLVVCPSCGRFLYGR
ncbi:MAG: C4-type zinc ribbon domain-containing protein [Litorilinea sp.]